MVAYAAHIPSNPLLLERISKHAFSDFKKMANTVNSIAKDMQAKSVETVLILTPSGMGFAGTHILNVNPEFNISFGDFGDFSTRETVKGETVIPGLITHRLGCAHSLSCITSRVLDAASAVVAMHLKAREKQYRVLPLTHSLEAPEKLFAFGRQLRDVLEDVPQRVAVISVGDLCRAKPKNAPEAHAMDKAIIEQLEHKNTAAFLKNVSTAADAWFARGARPLALALGLIDDMHYAVKTRAYQQIHGSGMLAAQFVI